MMEGEHRCPLCGHVFEEGDTSSCGSCPLSGNCDLIKCPSCGYEFVPEVDER